MRKQQPKAKEIADALKTLDRLLQAQESYLRQEHFRNGRPLTMKIVRTFIRDFPETPAKVDHWWRFYRFYTLSNYNWARPLLALSAEELEQTLASFLFSKLLLKNGESDAS